MPPALSAPITGLVAAVFTPFTDRGQLHLGRIPDLVRHLDRNGVHSIYICGSTGEGPSMTTAERRQVAEAWLDACPPHFTTIVQVGHTSLGDARELAAHAARHGADAISAVAPFYYPLGLRELIDFLAELTAAAPDLPFYYYHIPVLTGGGIDPVALLEQAGTRLPSLRGIKFTDTSLSQLAACQAVAGGAYDILFGRDEMLLPALAAGVRGAVGSTYNLAPALYHRIIDHFTRGDLETARRLQSLAIDMIRQLVDLGGEAAIKHPMHRHGIDCGPRRLPMTRLTPAQTRGIDLALDKLGFDQWSTVPADATALDAPDRSPAAAVPSAPPCQS